jgi:hypothetical protein
MLKKILKSSPLIAALWISPEILAQNTDARPEPKSGPPLVRAHAHNDYEHGRPLLDALDQGFCSIEADVWLVGGKLLVAHDRDRVKSERTLEALYLDPLRDRVRRNGGRVYKNGPGVILLVDVKSDGEKTYAALREVLKHYDEMLSAYRDGTFLTNAITVVVSGNRAPNTMGAESLRYAFVDGRMADLDGAGSRSLIPLISDNWNQVFKWRWIGPMPDEERQKLKQIVEKTHAQGRILRFWATPDRPEAWKILFDAGVDLINTDDLAGLRRFLLERTVRPPTP